VDAGDRPLWRLVLAYQKLGPVTGIVLAIPMFIRLISVPSLARLADRRSALRGALIASAFGSAAAYVVLACHGADHAVARRLRAQGSRTAWPRL
jgi:hypothetical protein